METNKGRRQQTLALSSPMNPIEQVQAKFKDLESGFRSWLSRKPMPVEAVVVTATGAAQGAAIGGLMGTLTSDMSSAFPAAPPNAAGLPPDAMASLKQAQQVENYCRAWFIRRRMRISAAGGTKHSEVVRVIRVPRECGYE